MTSKRSWKTAMLAKVVLVGLSVAVALVLAEAALRLLDLPARPVSGWKCSAAVPEEQRNQLSYRGRSIGYGEGDLVVLLVGDSQVEAVHCDFPSMPEVLLEGYLARGLDCEVRVFSLAAPGYGQDQEYFALKQYFQRYRADLVVLWETPANDVWNNIFPTHWPGTTDGWPKPTFWLEGDSLAGPSEDPGDPIALPGPRLWWLARRILGLPWGRDAAWEERLPRAYAPLESCTSEVREDWQRRWDRDFACTRQENLATEKSHLAIYLTPRSPRMEYGVELTNRLLGRIQRLCEGHGADFVAFSREEPPDPTCDVGYAVYELNGSLYAVSSSEYRQNVEDMNRGIEHLRIPVTVEDWKVGPEDSHLNLRATDQVMRDLASELLEDHLP